MEILKTILKVLTDPKNTRLILVGVIVVLIFLLMNQCGKTSSAKDEILRYKNNEIALRDTVRNFKDKWGNSVGEIKGLKLKLSEVKDSLKIEKGKLPITIVEVRTQIKEVIKNVPVYIKQTDTLVLTDTFKFDSTLFAFKSDTFGKSDRYVSVDIPFSMVDSMRFGEATFTLKQNIWLSASLLQNKRNKEIIVNVKSDYPNVTFNNLKGIVIDQNTKEYRKFKSSFKKSFGISLNAGVGYIPTTNSFGPYLGIGLSYTPKFLQW